MDSSLDGFIAKVTTAYHWLDELCCILAPEEPDQNSEDSKDQADPLQSGGRNIFIPTLDPDLKFQVTKFYFSDLDSDLCSDLEKTTFNRCFSLDQERGIYMVRNSFRSGLGFYHLSMELFSFLMLYTKQILLSPDAYLEMQFFYCSDDQSFEAVIENFWDTFAKSMFLLSTYNVLCLLFQLSKLKPDFMSDASLKNNSRIDNVSSLVKIDELFTFLEFFEAIQNSPKHAVTAEFFDSVKSKLTDYMETIAIIEPYMINLTEMKCNTSYVKFILCKIMGKLC